MARRSIKKIIEREFIAEGFIFVNNWKDMLSHIEESINNTIKLSNKFTDKTTIHSMDYCDLIDLVRDEIDNYNLIAELA
jgi:hypothetical protein